MRMNSNIELKYIPIGGAFLIKMKMFFQLKNANELKVNERNSIKRHARDFKIVFHY